MRDKKKALIKLAFEKAKKELPQSSTNSVASYLSLLLEEKYGQSKNERSFVRYYKALIENNEDYNIDPITLDQLSAYVGYNNFLDFSQKLKKNISQQNYGAVKIAISDNDTDIDPSSKIIVNITNSPVFSIPEFITQHKNGLGIVGILILGSLWLNQSSDIFKINKPNTTIQPIISTQPNALIKTNPDPIITNKKSLTSTSPDSNPSYTYSQAEDIVLERKKECMFWNEDHFEASYCADIKNNTDAKPLDEERLRVLKKINIIDTLTIQNAIGKVWYDKSDKQVEFFTYHGLHPTNGKTLKPITAHIINKYVNNN